MVGHTHAAWCGGAHARARAHATGRQGGKFAPTVLGFAKQLEQTGRLGGKALSEAKAKHERDERQKKALGMGSAVAKAETVPSAAASVRLIGSVKVPAVARSSKARKDGLGMPWTEIMPYWLVNSLRAQCHPSHGQLSEYDVWRKDCQDRQSDGLCTDLERMPPSSKTMCFFWQCCPSASLLMP